MATYLDDKGNEWSLRISPPTMKRVKDETGINLGLALGGDMSGLKGLFDDVLSLAEVLTSLVRPQLGKHKINADQYADGLVGDEMEKAAEAFIEAVIDFCPSRQAKILRSEMAKKMNEQDQKMSEMENDPQTSTPIGTNSRASLVSGTNH